MSPDTPQPFGLPQPVDLRNVCRLQLQQLAGQLSLTAIWIVYQVPESGELQSMAHYLSPYPAISPATIAYLESEVWLTEALPVLQLVPILAADHLHAYVCLLHPPGLHAEYLLLCASKPLPLAHQQTIAERAQLLSCYLGVYQAFARQRAEIQLLEHAIQRVEHQLRNPLALISLSAENLRLAMAESPWQEQARLIQETVSDLSHNLTELIHCGQQSKLRMAPYDLRAILIESVASLQPWLDQKQIYVHYPATSLVIAVDCWQLKQVLLNLLSNAVHFSPGGGSVTWDWHLRHQEALVTVQDQGPGLSEADLKQAFAAFYSRRPGGTGLGLTIAQKIILDHGGCLWAQNAPDGGAQFLFTLPRQLSTDC